VQTPAHARVLVPQPRAVCEASCRCCRGFSSSARGPAPTLAPSIDRSGGAIPGISWNDEVWCSPKNSDTQLMPRIPHLTRRSSASDVPLDRTHFRTPARTLRSAHLTAARAAAAHLPANLASWRRHAVCLCGGHPHGHARLLDSARRKVIFALSLALEFGEC